MDHKANDMLSAREAALLLGVDRKTVYRYLRDGLLEARWAGGWRITRRQVAACADLLGKNRLTRGRIGGGTE